MSFLYNKTSRSDWEIIHVDRHNMIIFIEDKNGRVSITNDAEHVRDILNSAYGYAYRIVYKDTAGEWWEIKDVYTGFGKIIDFQRWHGLAWDILKK